MKYVVLVIIMLVTWPVVFSSCSGISDLQPASTRTNSSPYSAYDGRHLILSYTVAQTMHDPDSFEHIKTEKGRLGNGNYRILMHFRGKNAFGAKVVNWVTAEVTPAGDLVKIMNNGSGWY